ncbi:MAG: uncharacterized protein JWN71_3750 [Xanthobacteraceae bacterium]|jgi:hypothetical protein|nr:uncharacterized protein [Xanthobacteraceae bacterium]
MAGTLFFVHGTGVRDEGFQKTLALIGEGARRNGLAVDDVRGTSWGTRLGVKLDRLADALPIGVSTRSLSDEPSPEEIAAATWMELLDDPYFELRVAATGVPKFATTATAGLPSQDSPAVEARARLDRLKGDLPDLAGTGLQPAELVAAIEALKAWELFSRAADAFGDGQDPELYEAMARSLVAAVLFAHRSDPPGAAPALAYEAQRRDALVTALADRLTGTPTRSISSWLTSKVVDWAKPRATKYLRDRRIGLTGDSMPAIGDVLLYQRRGGDILQRIAEELALCPKPVLAIGHSLGGIMLVDLLSRQPALPIDLLVTVGSQSPLLYLLDALEGLRPNNPGPALQPFTPWLNIYDPNDVLSFCAERVFAGRSGIHDREVRSEVPFPESHSAYWRQDSLYEIIKTFWKP